MSETVSKGMLALRRSKNKAERIEVGGEMFYFRKLTVDLEDAIDVIIKRFQMPDLKPPAPLEKGQENDTDLVRKFQEDCLEYKRSAERNFRKLTAELMRFCLLDECDKPLFDETDDVYSNLDNVYAEKFFRAYTKLRQGAQAEAAAAEARFPG